MRQAARLHVCASVIGIAFAVVGCTKEMIQPTALENDPAASAASWKSANVDPRWMKARDLTMQSQKLAREGRQSEALASAQEARLLFEQVNGPEHPDVAKVLVTMAELESRQKQTAQAQQDGERAVAILEKYRGTDPELDKTLSLGLAVLGGVYWDANKPGEAELTYRRALTSEESSWGQEHPHVATTLTNLAQFYVTRDRAAEAEPLLQRALAIREKVLGPDHPQVGMSVSNLALAKRALKKHEEAQVLEQRALAILKKTGDAGLRQHLGKYAQQLRNLGRDQDADNIDSQMKAIT